MKNKTLENKKQWLLRYSKHLQVEERLNNKLELLEDQLQDVRSPNYNGMPRSGTPITIADKLADILELYFIDRNSMDSIADILGYNTRHIYKLYANAIDQVIIPQIDTYM